MPTLRVLGLLLLGWVSAAAWAQSGMSVAEAKRLIAAGEQLQSIPRATWRKLLTPEQYAVLWERGTEPAGSGQWLDETRSGLFVTAGCRLPVFRTEHRYDAGVGWLTFNQAADARHITLAVDTSAGRQRVEVLSRCGEHLGYVFADGPPPNGMRYTINSQALDFIPDARQD